MGFFLRSRGFFLISRALLNLVCYISPRIQDSTVITRLLLLVYVTPESKWKLFDYGKNVGHLQWKLSLAGMSISLMVFPVFPPDWAAKLSVPRWGRGRGQQTDQGHVKELWSSFSLKGFCVGRNDKNGIFTSLALPGCSGNLVWKLRLQLCKCFSVSCAGAGVCSQHAPDTTCLPLLHSLSPQPDAGP